MDRKDLEKFMVELGCIAVIGESRTFTNYYKIDYVEVTYKMRDDGLADIYVRDHDETSLLTTLDFKEAAIAWKYPHLIVEKRFNEIIDKYGLEDNNRIYINPTVINSEEGTTDETETI